MTTITHKQAVMLEAVRLELGEKKVCDILAISKCAVHTHRRALVNKGLLVTGSSSKDRAKAIVDKDQYQINTGKPYQINLTSDTKKLIQLALKGPDAYPVLADALTDEDNARELQEIISLLRVKSPPKPRKRPNQNNAPNSDTDEWKAWYALYNEISTEIYVYDAYIGERSVKLMDLHLSA